MYSYIIFNPNQETKPQGNKVVQYFKILNSVDLSCGIIFAMKNEFSVPVATTYIHASTMYILITKAVYSEAKAAWSVVTGKISELMSQIAIIRYESSFNPNWHPLSFLDQILSKISKLFWR